MISSLRSLGVSPSLIEHAYGTVDHCLLDSLIKQSYKDSALAEVVTSGLKALMAEKHEIIRAKITDDLSLRLRHGVALSPECIDEVRYDQKGFTNFTPALHEGIPEASSPIIFARDLRGRNVLLRKYFSDREAYVLRDGLFNKL